MSTYQDCQNLMNNLSSLNMDFLDESSNASPPDFDFNLPCRYFKSSFARSLSLTNAGNNQCKSLDYDVRSNNNNNSSIKINNNNDNLNLTSLHKRDAAATAPPLPQKLLSQAGSLQNQNEATIVNSSNSNDDNNKQVLKDIAVNTNSNDRPPILPLRRPLSLYNSSSNMGHNLSMNELQKNSERKIQAALTQFKQQAFKHAINNSNSLILPVNCNHNTTNTSIPKPQSQSQSQHQQILNQKLINNYSATNGNDNNNNNNRIGSSNNFRRNNIVWPNQQNLEQDCNYYVANNDADINAVYHDTRTRSSIAEFHHYHNTHQQQSHIIPTITTTNIPSNQQQHQEQQHQKTPSYDIVNDSATNVEAVILQNQVDTLQWQLKQVETSCDMYRAVMEEVARFLERYQSQKQLQQQQQMLQQQQQQHKHSHSNNMEPIPRSKSLYQVYVAGGHEKSTIGGNNVLNDTLPSGATSSSSYLRARSSTNLIDLKQAPSSTCNKGHLSKDDQHFETGLTPTQSYTAFKDFTWRRSPKKANDARCNTNKDDMEEKLNQEAFRLLRTIQNLLNTSQHQPDIAHTRNFLAPGSALHLGRLSKAMSATSVMTIPGAPMLNSTSLTTGSNSVGSTTPNSSTASPSISTANASTSSNNLAPEMLFMRSANIRDSRLSLRSSTDSSVHSTSSAASTASSKVETDEEPSTPFLSPPDMSNHKQHHLTGSSTEDESGFSSISSFPDIGVPLNSTMLSSTPSSISKGRTVAKELKSIKPNERGDAQTPDSRNSTLKANVVGLPLNSSQDMSHRWDSPSKTYHNASTKFQRFSALTNEDSNTVLWV